MNSNGETRTLAGFAAGLDYADLPASVVLKAKQLLRDGLGNQLAASRLSAPARIVLSLLEEWQSAEEATVVGFGVRLPAAYAALVNAMLGHGVELDDSHANALTKAGSVLTPAALAMGEKLGSGGREVLTALVAGYETAIRVGLAVNPSHRKRGFHTTGTAGTFGAAAVGARLLGLDAEKTAHALGVAGAQAAGGQSFLDEPCMVKPLSPAKAAYNGLFAALLAARGFTGSGVILEGKEGFIRSHADEYDLGKLAEGLGERFRIMEVAFKPHAACRYAHGPIDIAQSFHRRAHPSPEEVQSIAVHCSELAIRQAGRVETPTLNSAMGSAPFGVALALLRGANGLADYQEGFGDPRVHALAKKVTMKRHPKAGEMGRFARLEVVLRDGRTLAEEADLPRGEP